MAMSAGLSVRWLVPKVVAVLIPLTLYGFARLPTISLEERRGLAAQFHFERTPLSALPSSDRRIRDVNASVRHIGGWISSVGASVALGDVDADGLSNDACLVDPRDDRVSVEPVPGTSARFTPFVLTSPSVAGTPTIAPMGCRLGDFNEDGLTDALVYYWGWTPIVFLRRAPAPGFTAASLSADQYRPIEIVSAGAPRWNTNAVTTADVDGDGHVDLIVANYFPDGAPMLDAHTQVPVQMQSSMARAFDGGVNRVMLWAGATSGAEPAVEFRDVPGVFPGDVARGWTLATAAADLDGDLLPEIYFANDFGPDRLLHNQSRPGDVKFSLLEGRKRLTTPNSKVLGRDSFKGMGVDFGDLNGDGILDIYVSNIANEYALEESHFAFVSEGDVKDSFARGIAPYVDASEDLGLSRSGFSWDARLGDFNNDGVLEAMQAAGFVRGAVDRWPELQELAMGNNLTIADPRHWPRFGVDDDISGRLHNPFFVRGPRGRFYDLAEDIGIGHPQVARGIAMADVDGDGRLDFAVARQWQAADFYRNRSATAGSALGLRILVPVARTSLPPIDGRPAGRPAIGATALLTLPDGRRLIGQVDGGNGHSAGRAPELHFGLGGVAPGTPIRVELSWRGTTGTVYRDTRWLPAQPVSALDGPAQPSRIHDLLLNLPREQSAGPGANRER